MNRRDLITSVVSGLLGTLVLPARLRNFLLRPKPIPTTTMADIKELRNKIAVALRIPIEYLYPPPKATENLVRYKDSFSRRKK